MIHVWRKQALTLSVVIVAAVMALTTGWGAEKVYADVPISNEASSGIVLYAADSNGNRYVGDEIMYLDPDSGKKVFAAFLTDGEYNLSHGLAPLVGFYDCIEDENGTAIGDLTDVGFKTGNGTAGELGYSMKDYDDEVFGIEIDASGLAVGTEGKLRYSLYKYEGENFWGDFATGAFNFGSAEVAVEKRLHVVVRHTLTAHPAKAATYTAEGNNAYWSCSEWGKYFSDAAGTNEIKQGSWVIAKLAKKTNPMKIKAVTKTVKVNKLRKKAQTVSGAVAFTKKAAGKVSYKGVGTNAKSKKALKINASTGKITVKKKTKKGTYSMKVTVSAAGNTEYKALTKTVTVTVKVK